MTERLHEIFYDYDEFGCPSELRRALVPRWNWKHADNGRVYLMPSQTDITADLMTSINPRYAISEDE